MASHIVRLTVVLMRQKKIRNPSGATQDRPLHGRQILLVFVAGVVTAFAGQFLFHAMGRSARVPATAAAVAAAPQPWGELQITSLILDRPDDMFEDTAPAAPEIRWAFPNTSTEQLTALFQSCELSEAQRASLLNTNGWRPTPGGWHIFPPLDLVRDLSAVAREKIYSVLQQSSDNPQRYPFTFREERFDELFHGCDLPPEKVSLVRSLCYHKNGQLWFADGQYFELVSTSNQTRCLFKTVLRVPTMLVKLRVDEQSDISALVRYWDTGGRARELKPLLQSLSRVPGGGALNISYFLPTLPRIHLYTYPRPTPGPREDCFWTSFSFFGERPGYRLGDVQYADQLLRSDYTRWRGEKAFGDLLLLIDSEIAVHACIYIADDIYYTKNGTDPNQPWVFMRMNDMMSQYATGKPQQWQVYRRKAT